MATNLTPYLNFDGTTAEAMEFYRTALGGELTATTFAQGGMPHDEAEGDKIMHAQLEAPGGLLLMAADVPAAMGYQKPAGFSVSLSGDDEPALRGYWERLGEGATIVMPLEKAPWGDTFGALTDRFGINWLVNIAAPAE